MERPGKGVVITTRHMPTPMADFSYQRGDGRWFNPDGAYLTPPWPEAKVLNVVHSDGWFTVTWVDEDLLPRNK